MSIVGQIVVESRRYSGWTDPRYPIGFWQAGLSLAGNASGGLLGIDLLFQQANGPARLNSQMYSVERFSISTDDAVNRNIQVSAVNMAGPVNQAFLHRYTILVDAITGVVRSSTRGNMLTMLPWFLGSQRQPGQSTSLSIVADNLDTIVFTFEAEGYRWSPRSVLVDGGPQRPPTGLYAR